jgi:hypothetical protein
MLNFHCQREGPWPKTFFWQADIFDKLTHSLVDRRYCREVFSTGQVIIPEGSDNDELYVIVERGYAVANGGVN